MCLSPAPNGHVSLRRRSWSSTSAESAGSLLRNSRYLHRRRFPVPALIREQLPCKPSGISQLFATQRHNAQNARTLSNKPIADGKPGLDVVVLLADKPLPSCCVAAMDHELRLFASGFDPKLFVIGPAEHYAAPVCANELVSPTDVKPLARRTPPIGWESTDNNSPLPWVESQAP